MDVTQDGEVIEGREVTVSDSKTVALLNKSEVEMQIETAHKRPRSVSMFLKEARQLATLNEAVAGECIYALPRDGKVIEGPSARFAEIMAYAWGNCRAGARVVNEDENFVTAQGVFMDVERNVTIVFEVQRRITTSKGRRYSADMIGVTGNAASSIALRNAILKGIPKAFWSEMYKAARLTSIGEVTAIANKRAAAIAAFVPFGVTEAQVLKKIGRGGQQDITIDDLVALNGLLNSIKENEASPESIFGEDHGELSSKAKDLNAEVKASPTPTGTTGAGPKGSDMFGPGGAVSVESLTAQIAAAKSEDDLALAADLLRHVGDEAKRAELDIEIRAKRKKLAGK